MQRKDKTYVTMIDTLRKSIQSFPLQRDFKLLTAEFHVEATERATCRDISSEKWKLDPGTFSIVYPNLQQ